MTAEKDRFAQQVHEVANSLTVLADGLANDGLVTASGVVLMGRQMIRALWTRLSDATKPPEAPPAEESPPEQPPPEAPSA